MKKSSDIKPEDVSMLVALLGTESQTIAGNMLFKQFPLQADVLINERWLLPTGESPVINIGAEYKRVIWRNCVNEYQYFSTITGWTTVPANRLKRYRLNKQKLYGFLQTFLQIYPTTSPIELLGHQLQFLGLTQFNDRYLNVYLCVGLSNAKTQLDVSKILNSECSHFPSIVITDAAGVASLRLPVTMTEVLIDTLIFDQHGKVAINRQLLQWIVQKSHPMTQGQAPLSFSRDYRLVVWRGENYTLSKKQAAVVEVLHKAEGAVHKDLIRAEADTDTELYRIMRNRVGDQWVAHPLWNTLIVKEGGGYYRLSDSTLPHPLDDCVGH